MYELGRADRDEHQRRFAALGVQRQEMIASARQPGLRQRAMLSTLAEDWAHVTIDERELLAAAIFERVTATRTNSTSRRGKRWQTYV